MKRWLLLENHPPLSKAGWLPPAEVWPELGALRAEHERLLAVVHAEGDALWEIQKRHEAEDAARSQTMKAAFLTGSDPGDNARDTEEERQTELADARLRVEAANDALETFVTEAMAEVQRRAPEWYETLDSRRSEADEKRAEAQRLIEEADRAVGQVERMRFWLDRESGASVLGHITFDQVQAPGLEHVRKRNGDAVREVEHAA